jgi:hypothetical protein
MRRGVTAVMAAVLIAAGASACGSVSGDAIEAECEHIVFTGASLAAAAGTSSCVPQISFGENRYQFACVALQRHQLAGSVLVGTSDNGEHLRARSIDGVPVTDAFAVTGRGHPKQCGQWQLAYGTAISRAELKALMRLGLTPSR